MTARLSAENEEALRARIAYFRDLGIYDFYHRGRSTPDGTLIEAEVVTEVTASADSVSATVTQEDSAAAPAAVFDPEIALTMPSTSAPPVVSESAASSAPKDRAAALRAIQEDIGACTRCALHKGRNTIVFGDGDPNARLMFVGEGPGADEDAQGLPFVGRAGQLLNNMIGAMGLRRDQVYIANIVKCRPPQNRIPEPIEANTCAPFLFRQIDAIHPEVIVALGSTAATYLLGGKSPLAALRGRIHHARGSKLIITYHPAYLLRDPRQKKEAWADLQLAMAELGLKAPAK